MTYTSATYSGELYFHYDVLGNTSLITDANSNPKASFQYDLHTGRLIQSWNPSNLEIINLNDGITGSINLTAIRAPGLGKDITIQPYPPVKIGGSTNGDNWGSVEISIGEARAIIGIPHVSRFGKDCGDGLLTTTQSRFFAGVPCEGWNGKLSDKDRKTFKDKIMEEMKDVKGYTNKDAEKDLDDLEAMISVCCSSKKSYGANISFKQVINTETGKLSLETFVCCPPHHDCS